MQRFDEVAPKSAVLNHALRRTILGHFYQGFQSILGSTGSTWLRFALLDLLNPSRSLFIFISVIMCFTRWFTLYWPDFCALVIYSYFYGVYLALCTICAHRLQTHDIKDLLNRLFAYFGNYRFLMLHTVHWRLRIFDCRERMTIVCQSESDCSSI